MSIPTESALIRWYFNTFRNDPLFERMSHVVEGSPWHRERNVAVHTDMVIAEFLGLGDWWNTTSSFDMVPGFFACAFHDVGKPDAMQEKFREDRGHYLSFGGHEIISARLWENWAVRHWAELQELTNDEFTPYYLYAVSWMIEHHLPYDLKKPEKLDALARTAFDLPYYELFTSVLTADAYGRISDDYSVKKTKVNIWCETFISRMHSLQADDLTNDPDQRVLVLPIAPSGAGKSTLYDRQTKTVNEFEDVEYYSWDEVRMQEYLTQEELDRSIATRAGAHDMYRLAYERSCRDKNFDSFCRQAFTKIVRSGQSVYVDNTNLTRKRRRPMIQEARRHNYRIVAVLIPCSLDTLLARQGTRADKSVPADAVKRQYMSLQMPLLGEVDDVKVMDSNLCK